MADKEYKEQPKDCIMRLSASEAAMIIELRQHRFGQFTIHKNMGEPTRIIIGGSKILDPGSVKESKDVQIIKPYKDGN
jgi:hypothetical protein